MPAPTPTWWEWNGNTVHVARAVVPDAPVRVLGIHGAGMTEDELLKETLLLFGWRRRTDALTTPVLAALRRAQEAGRVVVGADEIVRAVV